MKYRNQCMAVLFNVIGIKVCKNAQKYGIKAYIFLQVSSSRFLSNILSFPSIICVGK